MNTQLHTAARQPDDERRFGRGAWLLLVFALIFMALNFAQLAYRFTLPTDGWIIDGSNPIIICRTL